MRFKKFKIRHLFKQALVFALIFAWIFAGFPQIWNFPQEIPEAYAVTTAFRQEINIIDATVTATGDHAAIVRLDTNAYTGATFYFETVANVVSGTLTVALERAGTATQDSTISVTATSYTRQRSTAFTPPSGVTYYNINLDTGASGPSVQAARIIILQSADPLTLTQTQIEIGNEETGKTNTATAALSNPKYWKYTASLWDGSPTFSAQASFKHIQVASSTTYSTPGTFTYKESTSTSYITIEAWGAGGGGSRGDAAGAGGAGGGAYALSTTTASTPGTSHTLVVGTGQASDSITESDSTYDSTVVVADGGTGTGDNTAGIKGAAADSTGQVTADGGAGGIGHGTGDVGGGGGGAGGPHGAGNNGAGAAGNKSGAGGSGDAGSGGSGGTAVDAQSGGNGGNNANGGGGGGGNDINGGSCAAGGAGLECLGGDPGGGGGGGELSGGIGGDGQIKITETVGFTGIALEEDNGSFGGWTFKAQLSTSTIATSTSATTSLVSFTPTDGRHYRLVASTTGSNASSPTVTYDIYNAKIIVDQTSATKLETQYLIANTGSFGGSTGLKDFDTYFDPAEWVNVGNTYIHQAEGVSGGTGDVKLQIGPNDVTVSDITGSTITDVIELEQSSAMTMPGSATTTDVNVTDTGTLNASRILARVAPPAPTDITVAGFVYTDEGTTALSACGGAGTELSVVVGTTTPGQFVGDCTSGTGAFTITLTDTASLTAGTPIIGYIDGVASTFGSAVRPSGTGSMTGLIIRQNRVVIDNNATASTTDNWALGRWDNVDDPDVNYDVSGTTLVLESGHKLIVTGDDTFAPLGIASTTAGGASPAGDVQVDSGATLSMGTNDLRAGGDLMVFGTLSLGAGQITQMNGTRAGGNGFGFGNNGVNDFTFENLTIGGSVAITASSSFTVGSGDTLTVNSAGELALRSGKNATSSGTLTLNGTASGPGTLMITDTSSGPGTTGTLNAPVRFYASDADIASGVLDARTGAGGTGYGGLVEIYNGSGGGGGSDIAVNTVDTSTGASSTAYSFQRKTWYDGTRYWTAFWSGSQIEFWYSANGSSWTQNTNATIATSTKDFSVEADSSNAFIVYQTEGAVNKDIVARQSTSYPSTAFSWGSYNTVFQGNTTNEQFRFPTIDRDTNNKIRVIVERALTGPSWNVASKLSTSANDITAWGSIEAVISGDLTQDSSTITVPLAGGDMYAVWINGTLIEGKKNTAGTWDASPTSIAGGVSDSQNNLQNNLQMVSNTTADEAYLVYIDENKKVEFKKYTDGSGWQATSTIDSTTDNSSVSISIDTLNNNDLYAFWNRAGDIYWSKSSTPYTSWDAPAALISGDGYNDAVSAGYQDGGNNVFFASSQGTASPYNVRFYGKSTVGGGGNKNAILNSGTYDFNAGLNVAAYGGGDMTLLGTPNFPTINISATNGLDYTGTGVGSEIIYTGNSNTWTVTGNADLSNGFLMASSSNTFTMNGTSKTLTTNNQGFGNLTLSGTITTSGAATSTGTLILSGSTITLGSYASTTGDATISGTIYPQEQAVILGGLDKTLTGGGTVGGLIIRGEYTLSGSDLTSGTSTIITGASTTVATGRILTSTSSLSVVGTLDGNGTTSIQHSNLTGAANPNSHIQFSATTTTITMPQKTYGGNVEIFNGLPGAGTVEMAGGGTHTLNGPAGLYLRSTNGNITLDGAANSAPATIAGNLACVSGGGTKTLSTGSTANTWGVAGNVDFTNCAFSAGTGNTITMTGSGKTLTTVSNVLNHLTISGSASVTTASADTVVTGNLTVNSGTSLTLGGTIAANGNVTLGASDVLVDNGYAVILGSSGNFDPGGETIHSLWVQGGYTLINNDLTVSTTTIDTGQSLTVGTGRTMIATSTMTLQGTGLITGAGTTTFGNATYACSNLNTIQGTGLLSSNVKADATSGDCTIPARVFGKNLEILTAGTSRTITLSSGSSTVSQDLLLNASGAGNLALTGSANNPNMHIDRSIDFIGTGGGSHDITSGASTWIVAGDVDLTGGTYTATAGNTLTLTGASKTFTPNSQTLDNFAASSTASVTLAGDLIVSGNLVLESAGVLLDSGRLITLSGTSKNIDAGGSTVHNLRVSGTYTLVNTNLTVSTTTIDTAKSLTVGVGRTLTATSTMTLQGTADITGAGTTTFGNTTYACSNLNTIQGTGLLSSNVRADLTGGNCTVPARVFGSNFEIFSNSGSARTATLTTGSSTVSGALLMNVTGGANTTFQSVATTEMHVTGNVDLVTASGKEIFDHTNSVWQVSGDANFTGGGFVEPTASSTFVMNGSSKTLTAAGSFSNLDLASSVTLGSNASSTGDVRLANSVVSGSNTLFMNGASKTLNITGGSLSINNLNIISGASTTVSSNDLTVSDTLTVAGSLQVNTPRVVTSGNNESSDTLTLTGTIHGTGTTTLASSTLGTTGFINANVRFDISLASSTMPARTYNGNVEVYHNNATSRGLLMAAGTHTLNSALILRTDGTGNGTLDGGSNNPTLSVSGASIYIGTGSGREIMTAGSNNFTFSSALNISGGTFKTSSATTSVAGNYTNNDGLLTAPSGVFLLNGASQQTFTGIATGSSAFYDLAISNTSGAGDATNTPSVIFANHASTTNTLFVTTGNVTARFPALGTSTFQNINWNGQGAGTEFKPRSSISGDRFAFRVPGTRYDVSRVDFMDADECDEGNNIDASTGNNINSGNNNCIDFAATAASIVSAANQVFERGQATTSISQITITAGSGGGLITTGSDLRIAIATTTTVLSPAPATAVAMHWDYNDTTAAISGSPQTCTVGTGVSYEGSNSVLVVPISGTNCASGDQIIISGLSFAGFDAVNASATALYLLLNGATDVTANASNTAQYVAIKGTQTIANHTAGQESNKLDITQATVDNVEMFAFRLTPNYEGASTTQIIVSLSNVKGFSCASLNNLSSEGLYIDYNSNGNIDAGETATGTPSCSINASAGTGSLTFNLTYATSVARDFIMRADVSNNNPENKMVLILSGSNITSRGTSSLQALTTSGTITQANQFRGSAQSAGADIQPLPPGETPAGGGSGQGAGGGLEGGGDPGAGGGSGGGSGQGAGGDLPYVPSLLRPLASILQGLESIIAMLWR